jgi:hypothetical protein
MADIKTPTPLDLAQKNEDNTAPVIDETAGNDPAGDEVSNTEQVNETTDEGANESTEGDNVDGDKFPRSYVEKLRKQSATYRERAKAADELGKRLHEALVKLDGRLADPADLPFDAEHLDDPAALDKAIDALVTAKPGLRARGFTGDVGQGSRGTKKPTGVNLIDLMRG